MKHKDFISQLDEQRITAAIGVAERKSSGEIRVFISHRQIEDPLGAAQVQFSRLGMVRTKYRNGVLLYFAPATQRFAILGDEGIHQKCGESFWQEARNAMADLLKQGRFTEAIIHAVQKVGDLLAEHFPRDPDDKNELPDEIATD